jgi:SAM-dependent methyltransferase
MSQAQIITDRQNREFWEELCGSSLARSLGIKDHYPESLQRFDRAYLELYPYLGRHVPLQVFRGKKVLEVGLGYGTLGQKIAEAGADYHGLDIASGPVRMMQLRLARLGLEPKTVQGNMLSCPFKPESMDYVVAIGSYHHSGDLAGCINETHRVLKKGGSAFLMLYNRFSLRQWLGRPKDTLRRLCSGQRPSPAETPLSAEQKSRYDSSLTGEAAPETVFSTISQLKGLLSHFNRVCFHKENCDDLTFRGRVLLSRKKLLPWAGPMAGLDIYLRADK